MAKVIGSEITPVELGMSMEPDRLLVSLARGIINSIIHNDDGRTTVARRVFARLMQSPSSPCTRTALVKNTASMAAEEILAYLSANIDSSWSTAMRYGHDGFDALPAAFCCGGSPAQAKHSLAVRTCLGVYEDLKRALETLTDRQRQILYAVLVNDRSLDEVAHEMKLSSTDAADLYVNAAFTLRRELTKGRKAQ